MIILVFQSAFSFHEKKNSLSGENSFCILLSAIILRERTLDCVKTISNLFLESVSVFLLDNRIMLEHTLLTNNNNKKKKKKKKERKRTKLKSDNNNNKIKTIIFSNGAGLGVAFCFLCSDELTRKS